MTIHDARKLPGNTAFYADTDPEPFPWRDVSVRLALATIILSVAIAALTVWGAIR